MLIEEFLRWADRAGTEERADAAGALAKAYLYADLDPTDSVRIAKALIWLLEDRSPLVRRALAEAFAAAVDAPHYILSTLAGDRADIAAIVLERSPVLSDAELIDAVAIGAPPAQCAVARRPQISAALAGAIAEVGCAEAVLLLGRNLGADVTDFAVGRMLDRFGQDGALREALGLRDDLSPQMRHAVVVATAEALVDFSVDCRWMTPGRADRVVSEALDRATLVIASASASQGIDQARLVAYLRSAGHLTPALVLRALLSGNLAMFEAILCELSGKGPAHVGGLVRNPHGLGFAALYKRSGLPPELMPAVLAALTGVDGRSDAVKRSEPRLDRRMVERAILSCVTRKGGTVAPLTALLRRFEAEAVRDETRASANHRIGVDRMATPPRDRHAEALALPPVIRVAA